MCFSCIFSASRNVINSSKTGIYFQLKRDDTNRKNASSHGRILVYKELILSWSFEYVIQKTKNPRQRCKKKKKRVKTRRQNRKNNYLMYI